jgi:hypothetical protein
MTVAAVELWGTRIGAVALTAPSGVASFQYDPAFSPIPCPTASATA